jgi:hypothetical protein
MNRLPLALSILLFCILSGAVPECWLVMNHYKEYEFYVMGFHWWSIIPYFAAAIIGMTLGFFGTVKYGFLPLWRKA